VPPVHSDATLHRRERAALVHHSTVASQNHSGRRYRQADRRGALFPRQRPRSARSRIRRNPARADERARGGREPRRGCFAPEGTPADKVGVFYAEVSKAAESKRMQAFMARQYMVPELMKPAGFTQALRREVDMSRKLIEESKLKAR